MKEEVFEILLPFSFVHLKLKRLMGFPFQLTVLFFDS